MITLIASVIAMVAFGFGTGVVVMWWLGFIPTLRRYVEKRFYLWRIGGGSAWVAHVEKARLFAQRNQQIPGLAKVNAWKWISGDGTLGDYIAELDEVYAMDSKAKRINLQRANSYDDALLDEFKQEDLLLEEEKVVLPGHLNRIDVSSYPGQVIEYAPGEHPGKNPDRPTARHDSSAASRPLRPHVLPSIFLESGWKLEYHRDLQDGVIVYRAYKMPAYVGVPEAVVMTKIPEWMHLHDNQDEFQDAWTDFMKRVTEAETEYREKLGSQALQNAFGQQMRSMQGMRGGLSQQQQFGQFGGFGGLFGGGFGGFGR